MSLAARLLAAVAAVAARQVVAVARVAAAAQAVAVVRGGGGGAGGGGGQRGGGRGGGGMAPTATYKLDGSESKAEGQNNMTTSDQSQVERNTLEVTIVRSGNMNGNDFTAQDH